MRPKMIGGLMIVLGTLHTMATPIILERYSALPELERAIFVLMFVACGLSVALFGVVILKSSSAADVPRSLRRTIFGAAGTLSAALGVGAVWITPWNPVAYLLALTGFFGIWHALKTDQFVGQAGRPPNTLRPPVVEGTAVPDAE